MVAHLLVAIVTGVMVGWIASLLSRRSTQHEILSDIGLGVLGALLFGVVRETGSTFDGFLASVVGASLALALVRLVGLVRHRTAGRQGSRTGAH